MNLFQPPLTEQTIGFFTDLIVNNCTQDLYGLRDKHIPEPDRAGIALVRILVEVQSRTDCPIMNTAMDSARAMLTTALASKGHVLPRISSLATVLGEIESFNAAYSMSLADSATTATDDDNEPEQPLF